MWEILKALVPIILANVRGPIVEIGVGRSTNVFALHTKHRDVEFFTCDVKNHSKLFEKHTPYIGKSFDFMDQYDWDKRPSIVFIDGNHNYSTVKREFDFFFPLLLPGGVIFMHDTLPPTRNHLHKRKCSDAYKLREELEKDPAVNCFTWRYTAGRCGLTMVTQQPYNFHLEEERDGQDRGSG